MSHFYMFVITNYTVKLSNGNTRHAQGIGIILCCSPNCSIIYPAGPVYYCTVHPYNTISSCALKFYAGFQKVTSEPLEHFDFVNPKGRSWRSTYQTQKNLDYLQIEIVRFKPHRYRNIFVPNVCTLKKKSLSDYSSAFQLCIYYQTKINGNKRTHGYSPRKSP